MLIVCPNCASEYTLAPERVGAAGRQVRCAVCGETWFAKPVAVATPRAMLAGPQEPAVIEAVAQPVPRASRPLSGRNTPAPARPHRWIAPLAIAATLSLVCGVPALLALRPSVVRAWPQTATLYGTLGLGTNLVGLDLGGINSFFEEEGGKRVLFVEGEIRSASGGPVAVPRLEFTIEDETGTTLYQWATRPPVPEIAPGETTRFTARLTSPPPAGRRVNVSFRTRREGEAVASR